MESTSPPRSSADIYAGHPSRIPYPSFLSPNLAPAMASPVSVSSQRNSTLVHRGFYDLLSLVPGTPGVGVGSRNGASRFWNDPGAADRDLVAGRRYEDLPPTPATPTRPNPPPVSPTRSYGLDWAYNYYAGSPPTSPPVSPPRRVEESPKGKRRISKDMVSRPMGFV
jgi:protein-serine/threonine kinase